MRCMGLAATRSTWRGVGRDDDQVSASEQRGDALINVLFGPAFLGVNERAREQAERRVCPGVCPGVCPCAVQLCAGRGIGTYRLPTCGFVVYP